MSESYIWSASSFLFQQQEAGSRQWSSRISEVKVRIEGFIPAIKTTTSPRNGYFFRWSLSVPEDQTEGLSKATRNLLLRLRAQDNVTCFIFTRWCTVTWFRSDQNSAEKEDFARRFIRRVTFWWIADGIKTQLSGGRLTMVLSSVGSGHRRP